MPETRPQYKEALHTDSTSLSGGGARTIRVIELEGRQNLVDLVYRGRVRLYGEDDATVDLWGPEYICDDKHRVRLDVNFSLGMHERYNIDEKPLPLESTCILQEFEDVEVGSRLYGNKSFSVDGWDLYDAAGERIRHHNRTFVLRSLSRIELLVSAGNATRH
jgi:hypothetical protein